MITSFTVSNFRSFAGEQTLNLVASKRFNTHESHAVPIPGTDESALRTAVIYGANGAGKSNLFKALHYVQYMALQQRDKDSGTAREPFKFGAGPDSTSDFELRFTTGECFYEFGFKVGSKSITEEWLSKFESGKPKPLYQRLTDHQGAVKIKVGGSLSGNKKISALAFVGGNQNQTFLATLRTTLAREDYGDDLDAVIEWFQIKLRLIGPTGTFKTVSSILDEDPTYLEFAGEFLKASSTGINALKLQKRPVSEEELKVSIPKALFDRLNSQSTSLSSSIRLGNNIEARVERTDKARYYFVSIGAEHDHGQGKPISLDLEEESDGTKRLLQLIPVLHHLQAKDGVFFIDEIDRSMHPLLVWRFLDFFLRSCGSRAQVIVSTHESNLLDLALLRRDEIWFTQKDNSNGSSALYSLSEFNVRKDLEIRKHYLQGRFGAIPFLGNLDRLISSDTK